MTYEFKLNAAMKNKYGFTHLLCNGWFGIYEDGFNKKYVESDKPNYGHYIQLSLTKDQIDEITNNSECIEY